MKPYTAVVKIFSGGKVTIPKQIREVMRLQDGDTIEITISRVPKEVSDEIGEQGNGKVPMLA